MTTRLYLDVHALQTVPPSNINRDDTGSPKSASFGGVRRARVSSQAWKRAIRSDFSERLEPGQLGIRTKRVVELLSDEIKLQEPALAGSAIDLAATTLQAAGIKIDKSKRGKKDSDVGDSVPEAGYLILISAQQIRSLATLAVESADGGALQKARVRALIQGKNSLDLALFGRMVADVPDLNVDASAQVAHALSVHPVTTEFDYFTAIDDAKHESDDADAGAGMIGTVEFNSSTLYRYATVDVSRLAANLGDELPTHLAASTFVRSFIHSMPTGKQNTFANRTLPDAVLITLRGDQPVSLVGAFEDPVQSADGRVAAACARLAEHAVGTNEAYGAQPLATWVVGVGSRVDALDQLGTRASLPSALGELEATLVGYFSQQS